MKKVLCAVLAFALALGLVGCGEKKQPPKKVEASAGECDITDHLDSFEDDGVLFENVSLTNNTAEGSKYINLTLSGSISNITSEVKTFSYKYTVYYTDKTEVVTIGYSKTNFYLEPGEKVEFSNEVTDVMPHTKPVGLFSIGASSASKSNDTLYANGDLVSGVPTKEKVAECVEKNIPNDYKDDVYYATDILTPGDESGWMVSTQLVSEDFKNEANCVKVATEITQKIIDSDIHKEVKSISFAFVVDGELTYYIDVDEVRGLEKTQVKDALTIRRA